MADTNDEQVELDLLNYIESSKIEFPHLYTAAGYLPLRAVFDEKCLDAILRHAFLYGWRAGRQDGHRATERAIAESFDSLSRFLKGNSDGT